MKRNVLMIAMVVIIMAAMVFGANAAEIEPTPSQARWSLTKKTLGLGAGFFAGFIGHELGHQFVAEKENVDMTWSEGNWYAHTNNKKELRNIALGGFAEQMISSEIILGYDKIPKDNSFVLGYMLFNIINPIVHTIRHEVTNDGYEDLKTMDENGLKSEYIEVVIVSHALLSAWRLYHKKEFPLFIKATHKEIVIGLGWRW